MAAAARDSGLKHVIWSTLEDVRHWYPLADDSMPTLMGRYKVPHFDGKGAVDHVFTDLGVPTTFLRASFYWENFIYFGMGPKRNGTDVLTLTMPLGESRLPGIAAEDIGKCAYGIFKAGRRYLGETIGIAGEHLTGGEMADALGRALDVPVHYRHIAPADYRALGFPGADDLGNMFQFQLEHNEEFSPGAWRRGLEGPQRGAAALLRLAGGQRPPDSAGLSAKPAPWNDSRVVHKPPAISQSAPARRTRTAFVRRRAGANGRPRSSCRQTCWSA